jgi:hypothetical protein
MFNHLKLAAPVSNAPFLCGDWEGHSKSQTKRRGADRTGEPM